VLNQIWLYPPSTGIAAPVVKLLSPDARNKTALATSSAVAVRFNGISALRDWINCSIRAAEMSRAARSSSGCLSMPGDGVDPNVAGRQFVRPAAGEPPHGCFGRGVDTRPDASTLGGDGRVENDGGAVVE
jgi:hypothetical protein